MDPHQIGEDFIRFGTEGISLQIILKNFILSLMHHHHTSLIEMQRFIHLPYYTTPHNHPSEIELFAS